MPAEEGDVWGSTVGDREQGTHRRIEEGAGGLHTERSTGVRHRVRAMARSSTDARQMG